MADMRGSGVAACDDRCGCPSPCPGGVGCRCASSGTGLQDTSMEHKQCSCGEHCGCNPCNCSKTSTTDRSTRGTGKAFCRCGTGCTCPTCAAA